MGRKKIKIARIEDERSRQVTFLKRRNGVMKKAHELAVLTGSDVGLIIFNGQGKLSEFCSGNMRSLLQRYSQYSGPAESRGPQFYESLSREKEDDDDEEQEVLSISVGPSTSHRTATSSAMDSGMTSSSTLFGSNTTSASTSSMGTDLRLVQPMDPPSGAFGLPFGLRSSTGDIHETTGITSSGYSHPARLSLQTNLLPSNTGVASEQSPACFNSSRASSVAGHMSGITFEPLSHQKVEDNVFNFDQPTALPNTSQFGMNSHTHYHHNHHHQQQQQHPMSAGAFTARRSSFPTQHFDHSLLVGAQIVRPSTSAGGIQPGLHALAPSTSPFSAFSFQSLQTNPSPMTNMNSSMAGSQAPPSAWQNHAGPFSAPTSNLSSHFGVMPSRPQLFSNSSDPRMPSSALSTEHESPFVADGGSSQADLVDGINQEYKKRKQSGNDWTGLATSATPLRFSTTIPTHQDQHPSMNATSTMSSLRMPDGLGRLKENSDRSQSFSSIGEAVAGQNSFGSAMGMGTTPGNGSTASLNLSDSQFSFGVRASGLPHSGLTHTTTSSSAATSLSPVSTGTSAPGAPASVASAPSSISKSPSLTSGVKCDVDSVSHGAGGNSTSLPDVSKAVTTPISVMGLCDTSASSIEDTRSTMAPLAGESCTSTAGFSADPSLDVGMDLGQFVGNMMSQDATAAFASASHHQQQPQQEQQFQLQYQQHDLSSQQSQQHGLLQDPVDVGMLSRTTSSDQDSLLASHSAAAMGSGEHQQFPPGLTNDLSTNDAHIQAGGGGFDLLTGQAATAVAAPSNLMPSYETSHHLDSTSAMGSTSASAMSGYTEMQLAESQSAGTHT
ncbi:hypothetical protein A4X09_0g3 [Tilletia walkeri]|uniref:MADS-box domain-containing protein n=1 Tax=Tilletia walkeri TaxID=117179 RepID=A0A8X7NI34_9BASI|nr:hypothetical protein A4X09_0g3 [Tilletia walkeri]